MNEKVTQMVSLLFRDTEPTEEVQALHDEVLNNCQDRFADLIRNGLSEDDALTAVMESLKGMEEVLSEYPRKDRPTAPAPEAASEAAPKDAEEKPEINFAHFSPEDIRSIQARLAGCDVDVALSDGGISLEKRGEVYWELEQDGTLRIWQKSTADTLLKGISWEESLDSFEHFGDAMNRLARNVTDWMSRGFRPNSTEARLILRLPASLHPDVRIQTASGDITWRDAIPGKEFTLRSTSGDVNVALDESFLLPGVQICTMSGEVEARLSASDVTITTVSGDLSWDGEADTLKVVTTSGELEAIGSVRQAELNTTSGDLSVELRKDQPAKLKVNSVSGDIEVRVPESVNAVSAVLKTVSGNIKERGVELADDAPIRVELGSVSGSLKICK